MKKNKKVEWEIGTPEFNAWMKQIEREIWWDDKKAYIPAIGIVFFAAFFFLSLFFDLSHLWLIVTVFSIIFTISALIPWDSFQKQESHEVIKYETKEVHHHHHNHVSARPQRVTEVKEVRARLPNGTEISIRKGRKYD